MEKTGKWFDKALAKLQKSHCQDFSGFAPENEKEKNRNDKK